MFDNKWARGQGARRVDDVCFSCGGMLVKVVDNRLLQRGVCFDRGNQDGQVTFELVGYVRDGGVVFREFLFPRQGGLRDCP